MAAKRLFHEIGSEDLDHFVDKRMKTRPSFAYVVGEVMLAKSFRTLCNALEPLLRRVVKEEVEHKIQWGIRSMSRSPSMRIQAPEPSNFRLIFLNKISTNIFTGSKILDAQGNPLLLVLVDQREEQVMQAALPFAIKIELVVVDGDFASNDCTTWTANEFNGNIVKERLGKRPLLLGELNYTMRENGCITVGKIEFTDNSSWIKSRTFRIGARMVAESSHGIRVLEALTQPFTVKDQRGELYKKHYPPVLNDEVWRLEKIGKDGKFHKKLAHEGVKTIQDFLKLSVINPTKLKEMLGQGMSEKMWEATLKHAKTCKMGNKLYVIRGSGYSVYMDPICQVFKVTDVNGHSYQVHDLSISARAFIDKLVMAAYNNWRSLEVVERPFSQTLLLPQGDITSQCNSREQIMAGRQYYELYQGGILIDRYIEMGSNSHVMNTLAEDWDTSSVTQNFIVN